MGLTKNALRPRSDAGRGRRSGVKEDAARPRVNSRGIDSGGTAVREDAARPRARSVQGGGKLRDVKRPACFSVADRRVSKLRDGWGQLCRRHVESAGAKDALRPTCSGRNARRSPSQVSSGRSDQLQPQDRCPTGEGPTSNFNRRTWTEDEGPGSTPSIRPALGAKDQRQTPHCQHSLVGDSMVYPCNRDHAPRFLWSETLEKAKQCTHYYRSRHRSGMPHKGYRRNRSI